ncbi:MAG: luciferase family protein [Verrucomicrobiota bacterium]
MRGQVNKPISLSQREGAAPETTNSLPHSQLTQHGPDEIVQKLHDWCFSLPGVVNDPSGISVPGARALVMDDSVEANSAAFMVGREFAHIHPQPDNGSMHVNLTPADASEVVKSGWGEDHYLVTLGQYPPGLIMLFSPRDEEELETIQSIVKRAYEFTTGALLDT